MQQTESTELKAGPLRLQFVNGELRYLCLGEIEVLRRVYVAVRDCFWRTVPLQISNLEFQISDEAFRVSFNAAHQQDELDFRWQGIITGDAQGALTFTMDGAAHSDFLRNRIGFCVLHPPECAGQSCCIEHADGAIEQGGFPHFIAPHQPFQNIRAITHKPLPGVSAEVRFSGDVFEMEDQRNWTDGSFKTYSTPLALSFPVAVKTGERLQQSCTLKVGQERILSHAPHSAQTIKLHLSAGGTGSYPVPPRLPQLGLGLAASLSQWEIEALRALKLSHLRVDLTLSQSEYKSALARAVVAARALNAQLEAVLCVSDNAEEELRELRHEAERLAAPIARWLIFHQAEKVTAEKWLQLAREMLGPTSPIVAGANQYFTELNRQRPSPELLKAADALCYSLNPQVHATDDDTLREALAAQAATVESAQQFSGGLPLIITPVTLKPRFNPHAPTQLSSEAVDIRQRSLFAAAWTLGSLKYLAESGAASVTYYETSGARGVLETGAQLQLSPLWHVLAEVGEWAGAEVLPMTSSAPLKVIGLTLRRAGRLRLLLANLSGARQTVRFELGGQAAQLRRLNEHTLAAATQRVPFAPLSPAQQELELAPYEIVSYETTLSNSL